MKNYIFLYANQYDHAWYRYSIFHHNMATIRLFNEIELEKYLCIAASILVWVLSSDRAFNSASIGIGTRSAKNAPLSYICHLIDGHQRLAENSALVDR